MGGHSHWSTIKRHKAAQDAKRGKVFTRLIREVTIAARHGGDPDANSQLRLAISKAKEANMPADTIKRAIQRGTGELPGVAYEEITLEGYGPGGTAILLDVTTDNRNRTVAEIRSLLAKHGGSMAEAGAVAWQFDKKGVLVVERAKVDEDRLLSVALESGAEDVRSSQTAFDILTAPQDLETVKAALLEETIEPSYAEVTYVPQNQVPVTGKAAEQVLKLVEVLDDHDDVQKVYANFDIPDEVMEQLEAAG